MKKIGIIGAMELEVTALKKAMTTERVVSKAGMNFYEGTLDGHPVVVVQSGVGKVNAGMCVQILVDLFEVTHVINTGVAGSLDASLDIGDILISTEALQHDVDATLFHYAPGQIPGMKIVAFPADPEMITAAVDICKRVNPDVGVRTGRVLSGDQFISSNEVKSRLISCFAGSCAEMEGAAIAQAAYLNNLPFIVIRAISDKADDSAKVDYPTFEKEAAAHCAKFVAEFVKTF